MLANRGRDTGPEVRLRAALHRAGLRFFKNRRLPGFGRVEIDVVFPRARLAVFLDGCYWHGCPEHASMPIRNGEWWRNKLEGNRRRDRATTDLLIRRGWTVLRVWEHEDPVIVAARIRATLDELGARRA